MFSMRKQCKNKKTGEITMYNPKFNGYYIILYKNQHDGLWYPLKSLDEKQFNELWVDLNDERKEKITRLNGNR